MHQQLSLSEGLSIEDISLLIGADVHSKNKKLSVLKRTIGILKVYRSRANAFDLCSEKRYSRFVLFVNEILMISLFILGNYLISRFLFRHGRSPFVFILAAAIILPHFSRKIKCFTSNYRLHIKFSMGI